MVGKWKGLMVLVAGLPLSSLPVLAQAQGQPIGAGPNQPTGVAEVRPTGPDQELVGELVQLGRDEIVTASLADKRAVSPRVSAFALTMRREHRIANDRLEEYATRKNMNMDVIARPGTARNRGPIANATLVTIARDDFDYNFMSRMVADHEAAIDAATAAQRIARDPELKGLLGSQLVMMSDHLAAARELLAQIPPPKPPVVLELPAYPPGVSRTQTGADDPPPQAVQQLAR